MMDGTADGAPVNPCAGPPAVPLRDPLGARLAALRRPQEIPGGARRAAVAAALRTGPGGEEVLLMRRALREGDRWAGQVSLPGGHVDPTDADEIAAARRETLEEVGLDLTSDATLLGALTPLRAMARGRAVDLWITPLVFRYHGEGGLRLGPEADAAFWLPLGPAARGELDAEYPYEHEGKVLALPSWRHGAWTVWGLTHRILRELVHALPDSAAKATGN
jgi:8-oxo-dGTP pyrophosphatase MutT (NUDIX family)